MSANNPIVPILANTPIASPSAEQAFLDARAAHVAGNPALAEQGYELTLRLDPGHADALHLLGVLRAQQHRPAEAEPLIRRAIALKNDVWAFHDSLGKVLQELRKPTEARESFLRASTLKPDFADGLIAAAFLSLELGDLSRAVAIFTEASNRWPDQPVIQNNLGNALYQLGRNAEAEQAFRKATRLAENYAVAHYNLGNLLHAQRRFADAIQAYQDAIRAKPDYPEALNNLGNLYLDLKQFENAESNYRRAQELSPTKVEIITNLGNLYAEQKRYPEAESCFQLALAQNPALLHERVLLSYCKRQMCAWNNIEALNDEICRGLGDETTEAVEPLQLFSELNVSPFQQLRAGRKKVLKDFAGILQQPPLVDPQAKRHTSRLRIGYLSADVHAHATMHLLLGILEQRDSVNFETFLYSYGPDVQDSYRQRARQACEHFRDLRELSDRAAAELIVADAIDILIDLKGYTTDCRLGISAWRPAPILVSWLGYPGTLGHHRLADYIIGDPIVTPVAHAAHFSETLALMPHCYQPNDAQRVIGRRPSRREAGLPDCGFVFCSFNQAFKINHESFAIWCRLLQEVPDSVLWLLEHSPIAKQNLRQAASRHGIDPRRIIFAGWASQADHLGRLQLADLALDTFPYGSHTTGSDALWAGVPMVSLKGETFASRVSASLLNAIGLSDLVTETWEDYFALAKRIATDTTEHARLKRRLLANRATMPLFNTLEFARDLEGLYQAIWRQQQAGVRDPIVVAGQHRSTV